MNKNSKIQNETMSAVLPNAKRWWQKNPKASLLDIERAVEAELKKSRHDFEQNKRRSVFGFGK